MIRYHITTESLTRVLCQVIATICKSEYTKSPVLLMSNAFQIITALIAVKYWHRMRQMSPWEDGKLNA